MEDKQNKNLFFNFAIEGEILMFFRDDQTIWKEFFLKIKPSKVNLF